MKNTWPVYSILIVYRHSIGHGSSIALYKKLQRTGQLERDVDRLIRNDRIAFGSSMVACKDADAMVTGNTRRYSSSLEKIVKVVDPRPGQIMFGLKN